MRGPRFRWDRIGPFSPYDGPDSSTGPFSVIAPPRDRAPASGAERILEGSVLLCCAALLAAMAWPLFTGRVFVTDDLANFHLPLRYLYQQALQAGDTVLWTPAIFSGFYVHGEGQLGAFHPLHQLLYRLLPLGIAFNLEMLTSFVAAGAGMVWFLRRLGLSRAAALTGAMLFAFSGFMLLHHHHLNMIAVVAHLPWLLAGADAVIVEPGGRAWRVGFVVLASGIGSAFLLGFPQAVWWDALVLGMFALWRTAHTRRWLAPVEIAAAVAIGTLIGGAQWLPTADAAAHSVRASVGGGFALVFSLHPVNLLQLIVPRAFAGGGFSEGESLIFHEVGVYAGALLPIALCWMWSRWNALPARRPLILAATVLVVLGVWLALGRYGGLAGLVAQLPVVRALRAPTRYIVLAQFALAVLAALTVDDLLAICEGRTAAPAAVSSIVIWLPLAAGVMTGLMVNTGWLDGQRFGFASAAEAAPGVAFSAGAAVLIALAARRVRWALPGLVLLAAIDMAAWGVEFMYRQTPRGVAGVAHAAPAAPRAIEASYAAASDDGLYLKNQLVLRGYRLTTGYVGLFPATRHAFGGDEALRLSGTRWRFSPEGIRDPVAGTVDRVRLLEPDGYTAASGNARMAVDRPGRLVAHVVAPGPRILAFTERFHAGWSAASDGRPLPMVRVDGDFLGCVLEPGAHRVTLRFMPRSFVYGSIVSAVGIVLLAGVLVVSSRRRD